MRLGIRLQLLIALGVLLTIAFVPLYFAVARLTEASLAAARRDAARDLGRAVAGHVLSSEQAEELPALLEAQLTEGGVLAIARYDEGGARAEAAGAAGLLPATLPPRYEGSRDVATDRGACLLIVVPRGDASCAVLIALETSPAGAPLVRLVGLYTGVVAAALLIFAYLAMTRLVVKPVTAIAGAAERVAAGARRLDLPLAGAAELRTLTTSLAEMTERLLADEEALRGKVRELEATTHELASAHETVIRSERLASVGRLAAGMAHEIGNPLAALLGLEDLLLSGELPPEERRDILRRMKRETERIHRVLRDLLAFARTRAEGAPEEGTADVGKVVRDVLALLAPQGDPREVEMVDDLARDLPDVALSDERLQQVLLNVTLNAVDAVPRPGGRIVIGARRDGDAVTIDVDDNGPGVAVSVRDRLFEPFITTKEVGKGTGLGLAVCKGLVEAAGGTVIVSESPAGGARFSIRLPVAG